MKKLLVVVCLIVVFVAANTHAIDRDARMIDQVNLDLSSLGDIDAMGISISGESVLADPGRKWAIVAGVGAGEMSPDYSRNIEYWRLAIGLKYYIIPVTSVSVSGTYAWFDGAREQDVKGATARLKQRLLPADRPVSPFVHGSLTSRRRSSFSDIGTDNQFTEILASFGAGCDFMMNDSLSFVFETAYVEADESEDGTEDLDGWTGTISMKYYFDFE